MNKHAGSLGKRLLTGVVVSFAIVGGALALTGFTTAQSDSPPTTQHPAPVEGATSSTMRERLLAEYPGVNVPSANVIRAVTLRDAPNAEAKCLQQHGFDSTVVPGGGVITHVASGKDESFQVARVICATEYPLQSKYTTPLTNTQVAALYKYQKNVLSPCLVSHGFTVPTAPELSRFQEKYGTADSWQPYAGVRTSSQAAWDALNASCPSYPARLFDK
jgi:hypothetical protein